MNVLVIIDLVLFMVLLAICIVLALYVGGKVKQALTVEKIIEGIPQEKKEEILNDKM